MTNTGNRNDFLHRSDNLSRGGVRMGAGDSTQKKRLFIAGGAVFGIGLIAVISIVVLTGNKPDAVLPKGCQRDADCDNGRFCAAGGCIVLLSSEHRGIWRDDIAAQQRPGSIWQPVKDVGERLSNEETCPLPERAVPEPRVNETLVQAAAAVIEVHDEFVIHHLQKKIKGTVWIDAIRFDFDDVKSIDSADVCGTDNAAGIKLGNDADGHAFADVLLKTAAPSGKSAIAGISVRLPGPKGASAGEKTLQIHLLPPRTVGLSQHTAVAFPLGTDIFAVSGPKPDRQQLFKGYVVYDFNHTSCPVTVSFRYKINSESTGSLDLTAERL